MRFRDSFCLASVFEMTVYLLTYLQSQGVGPDVLRVSETLYIMIISITSAPITGRPWVHYK